MRKFFQETKKNRACFGDHRVKGHAKMIQTYRCKEEVNPKYIIHFICYVSTEIKKNKSTEYIYRDSDIVKTYIMTKTVNIGMNIKGLM